MYLTFVKKKGSELMDSRKLMPTFIGYFIGATAIVGLFFVVTFGVLSCVMAY